MAETSPDRPPDRRAGPTGSTPDPHAPARRTFVVGFRGNDTSWRAVAYAVGLARRDVGACRLVVVTAALTPDRFALCTEIVPLARAAHVQVAGELRTALEATLADTGVEWELRVVTGEPYRSVARMVWDLQADAVVVGRSRRVRWFSRSMAVRLAKRAGCPVIVVP
jgi:nucleotide-binding universal stress UspA family protein